MQSLVSESNYYIIKTDTLLGVFFYKEKRMTILEIIFLSFSLAMDAFAVSICMGLERKSLKTSNYFKVALWFGFFQGLMPMIGYFLGSSFKDYIEKYDHWIAFALLLVVGLNMIREGFEKEKPSDEGVVCDIAPDKAKAAFGFKKMFVLAVATSIDALAVGVSIAFSSDSNIFVDSAFIAVITGILSAVGLFVGKSFGSKYRKVSVIIGGIILILIGVKIVLQDIGILNL